MMSARPPRLRVVMLAALAVVAVWGGAAAPADAIVGGTPAAPGQWPWMAAVLDNEHRGAEWSQFCGAAVIAPRRVLTAAHCVLGAGTGQVDVLIGRTRLTESGGRRLHVTAISIYPGYVSKAEPGLDAATMTLSGDAGVTPLALARPGDEAVWPTGTQAWTLGWGRLNARVSRGGQEYYADRLRQLSMPIAGDDACEGVYGIGTHEVPYRPAWMLCAGTGDGASATCYGDSGGPLVVAGPSGWLDVGVMLGGDSCVLKGYYDLFARVDRVSAFALGANAAVQPDPVSAPRISGRLVAGGVVHCSPGRWRGSRATFTERWTRVGDASGRVLARGPALRLSARDARRGVRCTVTARNAGGYGTAVAEARPHRR